MFHCQYASCLINQIGYVSKRCRIHWNKTASLNAITRYLFHDLRAPSEARLCRAPTPTFYQWVISQFTEFYRRLLLSQNCQFCQILSFLCTELNYVNLKMIDTLLTGWCVTGSGSNVKLYNSRSTNDSEKLYIRFSTAHWRIVYAESQCVFWISVSCDRFGTREAMFILSFVIFYRRLSTHRN